MNAAGRWRWVLFGLLGVLCFGLFLVVTAPAHWMGLLLARASDGRITLHAARGSFWDGAGTLSISGTLSSDVRWSLQPLWLFAGQLRARLEAEGELNLRADAALAYRDLRLNQVSALLPANALGALYAPAQLLSPTGELQLAATELRIGPDGVHGEARLTWLRAGSRLGGLTELGDYLLVANGQGRPVALQVKTLQGSIQLDATGSWQANREGGIQLEGTLGAQGRESALVPLISLLKAQRDGQVFRFRIENRVPFPAVPGITS